MSDIIKAIIVAAAISAGIGIRLLFPSLKEDNPVEEVAEEVIKIETGVDIDLSPESPEIIAKKLELA